MVEPPLFTTFNGVEFPAHLKPSQMLAGERHAHASCSELSRCEVDARSFPSLLHSVTLFYIYLESQYGTIGSTKDRLKL